ncbi:G patch domain-containing protein 1 [Globisporangium polare]
MNQVLQKSHSLPPRPPHHHRRASLQESRTKSASSFSKSASFSKRRLDRHSSITPQYRLELSLLEHVQVEFVKAFVPASKLSQPRYVMRISNTALAQSWEMGRTFKEFYELKEAIVNVLDHGHFCHSNCPWIYMFATHHFPRRHIFRSRSPSVISARLTELQTFLNEILRMSREKRSLECAISADAFPRIVYDFLYEGMVFDRSDFTDTILEDRVSMTGVSRMSSDLSMATPEESCSICRRSLLGGPEVNTTISPPSSNAGTASGSTESDAQSLTTLQCGHVFHDDCILAKLNEHLHCPLCADTDNEDA